MEVNITNWEEARLRLIEDIVEAEFVTVDLELSGISTTRVVGRGRKDTLEERYAETKAAAEKYQVLQLGLCPVKYDKKSKTYLCSPYNIYVSPIASTSRNTSIDRPVTFSSSAAFFLTENEFDFNAVFRKGVPYLSHVEADDLRKKFKESMTRNYEDVVIDPEYAQFVETTLAQIRKWLAEVNPEHDFLNIAPTAPGSLNNYQKRIVHQIVRANFPNLRTIGKSTFVQIIRYNEERENRNQEDKLSRFNRDLHRATGLREIVDELFNVYQRDSKVVLVGHNLFMDIVNLYQCFIGPLPPTIGEFADLIRNSFAMVLDTKYVATADPSVSPESASNSSLQQLWESLERLPEPKIDVPSAEFVGYMSRHSHHEAGYDAFTTARVLLRFVCNRLVEKKMPDTQKMRRLEEKKLEQKKELERKKKERREKEKLEKEKELSLKMEGGGVSLKGSRFLALEVEEIGDEDEEETDSNDEEQDETLEEPKIEEEAVKMPSFSDEKFWGKFNGKMRVYGTIEGLFNLENGLGLANGNVW